MPAIARGQENTTAILNWFTTVNGVLTDMYAVEYRIFDITGGVPGSQIFPATPGNYETVTSAPGNFGAGSYYAYDNTNVQGWTPGIAEPLGSHRIEWRWKLNAGAPYQSDSEDFEVLVQSGGSSVDTYITVADVNAEGLTDPPYTDEMILAQIEIWQAFLDRACRQWFVPKTLTIEFDGTDSDAIHFGVPIIEIDSLKLNGSTASLSEDLYKVYNGRSYPDDRRNPRIKLVGEDEQTIYTAPIGYGRLRFRKGRKNQVVSGTFGFIEDNGSTPKLIQRALLKLVIEKLTNPIVSGSISGGVSIPPLVGALIEEETDEHRMKYSKAGGALSPRQPGLSGVTSDQEILDIIKLYKAPLGIATPASPSYG